MSESEERDVRKWAALIYIAGDNDLSARGNRDLEEIRTAMAANSGADGSNSLYIGVEIDTRGKFTGSTRYEIDDEGHQVMLERLPEKDTGSPKTLAAFLQWGVDRFPAKQYLAVIWGHGTGFKTDRRAVAGDENGTTLEIPGILWAIDQAGLSASGKRRLAVLGFDACLMGMAEIAYSLQGRAEVLVGSQQIEPGDGWPYQQVLQAFKDPAKVKDAGSLGGAIAELYIDHCIQEQRHNVTQSAIQLGKMDKVITALGDLGDALGTIRSHEGGALKAVRIETQSFDMPDYIDLIDFCRRLRVDDRLRKLKKVKDAATALEKLASDLAILKGLSFGTAMTGARGLSIWFPNDTSQFSLYRGKYLGLGLRLPSARKSATGSPVSTGLDHWVRFLDRYHGFSETAFVTPRAILQPYVGAEKRKGRRPQASH